MGDIYRYFSAFLIPILLIVVSAFAKKIMRKTDFCWEDFYLGVDLTIAAFSVAVVNVLDLTEPESAAAMRPLDPHAGYERSDLHVGCFVVFVLLVAFHQQWKGKGPKAVTPTHGSTGQKQGSTPIGEILLLGFASNMLGIFLLGSFIVLKIKGKI